MKNVTNLGVKTHSFKHILANRFTMSEPIRKPINKDSK